MFSDQKTQKIQKEMPARLDEMIKQLESHPAAGTPPGNVAKEHRPTRFRQEAMLDAPLWRRLKVVERKRYIQRKQRR